MRKIFIILIGFILLGSLIFGQQKDKNDIQGFNNFLGKEKSNALNTAVESFEQFLLSNYPNQKSHSARTKSFLKDLKKSYEFDSSWTLTTEINLRTIEAWETTGLRNEILLFGYEEYDPKYNIHELLQPEEQGSFTEVEEIEEIELDLYLTKEDSVAVINRQRENEERSKISLHSNVDGAFIYGLAKFAPNDTLIQNYVYVKVLVRDISSQIIVSAFLEQDMNFDDPFIKRMIVTEIYFWIMKWDIERKNQK